MKTQKLSTLVEAYLIAALWSSNDESTPQGGEPFDKNYSISDLHPDTIAKAIKDCDDFQSKAGNLLDALDNEQAGHDFCLTRNHHGAGFWDRGLGEIGDKLTDLSHEFNDINLYIGDDKNIYFDRMD